MKVIPVPFTNTHPNKNISDTSGTKLTPAAIKVIYDKWRACGVNFANDDLTKEYELDFRPPSEFMFFNETSLHHELLPKDVLPSKDMLPSDVLSGLTAQRAFKLYGNEPRLCFLGGDHSITRALFKEFRKFHGEKVILVALDAHSDLCNKGVDYPYHSDWLRFVIDRDGFDPRRVLCVGWRRVELPEIRYAKEKGITVYPMHFIREISPQTLSLAIDRRIHEIVQERNLGDDYKIYLTLDFDALDPSFTPAVSTLSPLGLSQVHATSLVKTLARNHRLRAFDMTEINPPRDINDMTLELALTFLGEFASGVIQ